MLSSDDAVIKKKSGRTMPLSLVPAKPSEETEIHTRILRLALAVEESRAYWEHVDSSNPESLVSNQAFEKRWFGAKSAERVRYLIASLNARYVPFPNALLVLRQWSSMDLATRQALCHWHLQLSDPIYRRFTGQFLVQRRNRAEGSVDRDIVFRWVAFASIHRWKDDTLNVLLADHLVPEKRRLEGELEDIRKARTQAASKGKAEKRFAELQKLLEELTDFIEKLTAIAECGPPPPDDKTPKREVDARFTTDLDDGVMVNSTALWPLLEPQWKDPKKWWKELATAQGRKDYDWAHLAARYFPKRVREKCVTDPSLAVAHKCFWELHPAKAYAWELRLQDEIRPEFTIDEPESDRYRAVFYAGQAKLVKEIEAAEAKRRERKAAKAGDEEVQGELDLNESEDADG